MNKIIKNKIPSIRTVAMPADTNSSGDIFGGWVLSQMDLAGGVLATQVSKKRVTTISWIPFKQLPQMYRVIENQLSIVNYY